MFNDNLIREGYFEIIARNERTGQVRRKVLKNLITDRGLEWQRGNMMGVGKYRTIIGQAGLGTGQTPPEPDDRDLEAELSDTSEEYRYSRKTMVTFEGIEPGEIVADAFWSERELIGVTFFEIGLWTIRDDASPIDASPIFYARTVLPEGFTKNEGESLTITRREYIRRG